MQKFADELFKLSFLFFELFSFKSGQLSQTHLNDVVRLNIVKAEAVHKSFLALGNALRGAENVNDLVYKVERF